MVAVRNIVIFFPVISIFLSVFFSSANLSGQRLDVLSTILPQMVWP